MVEPPAWLDELALRPDGPPWLSMGLSRCDERDWLQPDDDRHDEVSERSRLVATRRAEVLAALPGSEDACAETCELVGDWLRRYRPELPGPATGTRAGGAADRLAEAGLAVQEDLCLMVPHDDGYRLDAACLCFPSHWRLSDKLGRSAHEVHGPVPRYADELAARVDRYLDRLRAGVIGVRRNWSVHDAPDLFAPVAPARPVPVDPARAPDALFLRSERQTLRRLPRSGAVLFTIRVQQVPLRVLEARPDVAAALAARLRAQPDELTAMNGLVAHGPAALAWLDAVTAGAAR